MVKHTQAIRRHLPVNCLSVFDYFVELVLKWLKISNTAQSVFPAFGPYPLSVFSCIWTEYESLQSKSPHIVSIRANADQKNVENVQCKW